MITTIYNYQLIEAGKNINITVHIITYRLKRIFVCKLFLRSQNIFFQSGVT